MTEKGSASSQFVGDMNSRDRVIQQSFQQLLQHSFDNETMCSTHSHEHAHAKLASFQLQQILQLDLTQCVHAIISSCMAAACLDQRALFARKGLGVLGAHMPM